MKIVQYLPKLKTRLSLDTISRCSLIAFSFSSSSKAALRLFKIITIRLDDICVKNKEIGAD